MRDPSLGARLEVSERLIEHGRLMHHYLRRAVIMLRVWRHVRLRQGRVGLLENLNVEVLNLIDHRLR